jgi:chemotaxis protein CheD
MMATAVQSKGYKDSSTDRWTVKVLPGGQHVSTEAGELVTTVLGSCVTACVRDPLLKIGGMNHFMLPFRDEDLWEGASRALRYGNFAMDTLVNELMKLGAERGRLETKFFGGADVLGGVSDIGIRNGKFAREYARAESMNVVSFDLGGTQGRRVLYDPSTGQAWRRWVKDAALNDVTAAEKRMQAKPSAEKSTGSIELF